jgi:hypothetical protein
MIDGGCFCLEENSNMQHINGGFDPEATQTLCLAFDAVCETIARSDQSELVRELIARRVMALAERGLRDPNKIAEAVTSTLGLHRGSI